MVLWLIIFTVNIRCYMYSASWTARLPRSTLISTLLLCRWQVMMWGTTPVREGGREGVDTSLVLSQPATVGYRDDEAPVSPAPAPHCRPPSTTAPVGLSRTPAVRTGCLCWEKSLPALSVWLPALDWTAQSREQRKVPHWPASNNLRKGWEFFQGGRKYEQKQDSFRGVKPTKDIRKY